MDYERTMADFTLEVASCRTHLNDGSFTTSVALYAMQQTLTHEWNKVRAKYLDVKDNCPEPTVDKNRAKVPDGPQKTAYLKG